MSRHNREITIKKSDLLTKIKENKENHIKEYDQAVIDYKKEATLQLESQLKAVSEGSLKAHLQLITPVNNSEQYDKVIKMFEWELKDEVTLSQDEFNEYVLDESGFAIQAKMLNSTYRGKF